MYLPLSRQSSNSQEEEVDPELAAAVRKTRKITRFGVRMAEIAAACILLCTLQAAIVGVGVGLTLAFVAWVWSQRARRQVDLHNRTERLTLLATSSDLLARILLLAGLYAGYFYASQVFSFSVFIGMASVCIVLSSLLCILYYWQSDYAYRSQDNAGEQLGWQFDRLVVDSQIGRASCRARV